MKNLLRLIVLVLFTISCSKPDCDEEIDALNKEYARALSLTGSSWSASAEVTKQYNEKLNKIKNNCN